MHTIQAGRRKLEHLVEAVRERVGQVLVTNPLIARDKEDANRART